MKIINHLIFLGLILNMSVAQAECLALKNATNLVNFKVIGVDSPVTSVKGTSKNIYIEFKEDINWPAPFIKTDKNKDFYLRWEEDNGCMKIYTVPQDFLLSGNDRTWELKVHRFQKD